MKTYSKIYTYAANQRHQQQLFDEIFETKGVEYIVFHCAPAVGSVLATLKFLSTGTYCSLLQANSYD